MKIKDIDCCYGTFNGTHYLPTICYSKKYGFDRLYFGFLKWFVDANITYESADENRDEKNIYIFPSIYHDDGYIKIEWGKYGYWLKAWDYKKYWKF